MTGAEHYSEAERLLNVGGRTGTADELPLLAEAQVHATLALAAVHAAGPGALDELALAGGYGWPGALDTAKAHA